MCHIFFYDTIILFYCIPLVYENKTYMYITEMHDMPYHVRLKSLELGSLKGKRESYIIYIWISVGVAPKFSIPITFTYSERRCRSCVIYHVNVVRVGTLAYNSFRWRSVRLFNSLPMHLRF